MVVKQRYGATVGAPSWSPFLFPGVPVRVPTSASSWTRSDPRLALPGNVKAPFRLGTALNSLISFAGADRRIAQPFTKNGSTPGDGIPVNHPKPRSVVLPPRNLTGHVTIAAASRGESQVTANEGWSLISEFEVSSFRSKPSNLEFRKKNRE